MIVLKLLVNEDLIFRTLLLQNKPISSLWNIRKLDQKAPYCIS